MLVHIAKSENSSSSGILKCSSCNFHTPVAKTIRSCPSASAKGKGEGENEEG